VQSEYSLEFLEKPLLSPGRGPAQVYRNEPWEPSHSQKSIFLNQGGQTQKTGKNAIEGLETYVKRKDLNVEAIELTE
jgi:hypothetical protein